MNSLPGPHARRLVRGACCDTRPETATMRTGGSRLRPQTASLARRTAVRRCEEWQKISPQQWARQNLPKTLGNGNPASISSVALAAAVLLGALGFVVPILVVVGFTVCRWIVQGASEFDRGYDLHWLPQRLIYPAVGTAFVFAAAGWATFAARGGYRFARTFATIFAISVPCWFALAVLGISPPRYKKPRPPADLLCRGAHVRHTAPGGRPGAEHPAGLSLEIAGATADQKAGPPAAS